MKLFETIGNLIDTIASGIWDLLFLSPSEKIETIDNHFSLTEADDGGFLILCDGLVVKKIPQGTPKSVAEDILKEHIDLARENYKTYFQQ